MIFLKQIYVCWKKSSTLIDADCVDPRDENTVIAYVSEIQKNYNPQTSCTINLLTACPLDFFSL